MQNQTLPRLNDPANQLDFSFEEDLDLGHDFGIGAYLSHFNYEEIDQQTYLSEIWNDHGKKAYAFVGCKAPDRTKRAVLHNTDNPNFCPRSIQLSTVNTTKNIPIKISEVKARVGGSGHLYHTLNLSYHGSVRSDENASVLQAISLDFDLKKHLQVVHYSAEGVLCLHHRELGTYLEVYDPVEVLEEIRCALEVAGLPAPQYHQFTGKSFQVHFLLDPKSVKAFDPAKKVRRQVVEEIHTRLSKALEQSERIFLDPACKDIMRFMRLPGTHHAGTKQLSRIYRNTDVPARYNTESFFSLFGVHYEHPPYDPTPYKQKPRQKKKAEPELVSTFELAQVMQTLNEQVSAPDWHKNIARYAPYNRNVYNHLRSNAHITQEGHRNTVFFWFCAYSLLHHRDPSRIWRELRSINAQLDDPMSDRELLSSLTKVSTELKFRAKRPTLDAVLSAADLPALQRQTNWQPLDEQERIARQREGQQRGAETKRNETVSALIRSAKIHGLDDKERIAESAGRSLSTVYVYLDAIAEELSKEIALKAARNKEIVERMKVFQLRFLNIARGGGSPSDVALTGSDRDAFKASLVAIEDFARDELSRTMRSRQFRTQLLEHVPSILSELPPGTRNQGIARLLQTLVLERVSDHFLDTMLSLMMKDSSHH